MRFISFDSTPTCDRHRHRHSAMASTALAWCRAVKSEKYSTYSFDFVVQSRIKKNVIRVVVVVSATITHVSHLRCTGNIMRDSRDLLEVVQA